MIYKLPVRLDNGIEFQTLPTKSFRFVDMENGYDSNNTRLTNIVGFSKEENDFLKKCPMCGEIKPSEEFGLRGTVKRDQSDCINCSCLLYTSSRAFCEVFCGMVIW